MTCIVAWVEKNIVYMGCDSAGIANYDLTVRTDSKIAINGEMIFGYTGSFRMGQLLKHSLTVPKITENKNHYEYMCTDFIDAVRNCFKRGGYSKTENGVESGGFFLVGFRGTIYYIESDFQVGMMDIPYFSVGCGSSYALGACDILKNKNISVENKIKAALEVAYKFSAGVRPPFNFMKIGKENK